MSSWLLPIVGPSHPLFMRLFLNLNSCSLDNLFVRCILKRISFVIESECESGEVRLVDGADETEGLVEVCYSGIWGRVCDDYFWGENEARVVCRQLGFSDQCEDYSV